MKGRYAARLLLWRSSPLSRLSPSSSGQSSGPVSGSSLSCGHPPSLLFMSSRYWQRVSHARAGHESLICREYLHFCSSNSTDWISSSSSAQFSTATGDAKVWQGRTFADDAAKREDHGCWSCEQEVLTGSGLFCPSCKAIQPLDLSVDYFRIFNTDRVFKLDLKVLEQSYKDLQKKLHPDLASSKSQREQGYSAEQSAHVIQAYYILLRPLSRARYLLGLHGIKVEEEGTIDDPELLMQIMEIRESIEDISSAEDLKKAQDENNKRIEQCERGLESAFNGEDLKKAVTWVQRLSYFIKVGEEILRKQ